jgi:light-regulated signal transduction histidine kinase (bacteriophytochrome)
MTTPGRPAEDLPLEQVDLTNCDREPIRIPGSIQPHGVLLTLAHPCGPVLQASENVGGLLGATVTDVVGRTLAELFDSAVATGLADDLQTIVPGQRPRFLRTVRITCDLGTRTFHAVAHRNESALLLELEETREVDETVPPYPLVDAFSLLAEEATTTAELSRLTAVEVRRLTGYDRVLIYAFDEEWHGTVIGEDGNGRLPSLLDHRFPASDIPAQARELYRVNRLRLIPDSAYVPVPLVPAMNPQTDEPLDLSFSTLRSVSPIHVEYMRNMETASSMSVSILSGGRLWGLISCHHREPKTVPFGVRITCDLFARAFSLRLPALELARDQERHGEVRQIYRKLLDVLPNYADLTHLLEHHGDEILAFADASGAAFVLNSECKLLGLTPPEAFVRELAAHLFGTRRQEVFCTDYAASIYPPAEQYRDTASGVLAAAVSKLHPEGILWFRPEVVQTVKWGGDPRKQVVTHESGASTIQPRRSFETWKETLRGRSAPWRASEIDGAYDLRNAIIGIVLRKAEELAELNAELMRSNKELEAFSYSVSHDLRAPLRHIVGYAEMLKESGAAILLSKGERCVNTIIESSEYAGLLVDKLLAYSRMGRADLQTLQIDMNALFREAAQHVEANHRGQTIRWNFGILPHLEADLMMLRDAVRNLLDNAVKYSQKREESIVTVAVCDEGEEYVFSIHDNGVGFDQKYAAKLFGVFQRLHRIEDYEGTGIGLANVRRVMERHGGRTWAEGTEGGGATFYFALPKSRNKE